MERSLQLQREITEQRRAEGSASFICKGTLEIYDAGGLAFSQLHVGGLRRLAKVLGLGTANYPENLGKAWHASRFAQKHPSAFSVWLTTGGIVLHL